MGEQAPYIDHWNFENLMGQLGDEGRKRLLRTSEELNRNRTYFLDHRNNGLQRQSGGRWVRIRNAEVADDDVSLRDLNSRSNGFDGSHVGYVPPPSPQPPTSI